MAPELLSGDEEFVQSHDLRCFGSTVMCPATMTMGALLFRRLRVLPAGLFRWCRRPGQEKLIGWASGPAGEHRQIAQSWPVPSSSDAQAGSALVYSHQRYRLQPAPTNERLSHEMDRFTGSSHRTYIYSVSGTPVVH